MTRLKLGQVVQDDTGFYLVRNGANEGLILTPITVDLTRPMKQITPELEATLKKPYR